MSQPSEEAVLRTAVRKARRVAVVGATLSLAAFGVLSARHRAHTRGLAWDAWTQAYEAADCMTVLAGRGRFGNHVYDILWQLSFAISTGSKRWHLLIPEEEGADIVRGIFDWSIVNDMQRLGELEPLPELCPDPPGACLSDGAWRAKGRYLDATCPRILDLHLTSSCRLGIKQAFSMPVYSAMAVRYLQPLFDQDFAACLHSPYADGEEQVLTLHLRSEDLWPDDMSEDAKVNDWLWLQPPCQFYAKIIEDGDFNDVLIVTSPDRKNVCVDWFSLYRDHREAQGKFLRVRIQSQSIAEDGCALARARYLVLSYSSFPVVFALLGQRAKRIYTTGTIMTKPIPIGCDPWWASVTITRYPVDPRRYKENRTFESLLEYFHEYPIEDVRGPFLGCIDSELAPTL